MQKFAGGCVCGRIRYSGEAELLRMVACHCAVCQRFTGSAFMPVFAVPKGALAMTGEPHVYTEPGGTSGLPLIGHFARPVDRRSPSSRGHYADEYPCGHVGRFEFLQTNGKHLLRDEAVMGSTGSGHALLRALGGDFD